MVSHLYLVVIVLFKNYLCGRRDLNSHALRHQLLRLACIPISPRPRTPAYYHKFCYSKGAKIYENTCH